MSAQNSTSNDHLNSALSKLTSLVDNSFECSICLDTFSDPHVIPECLHRFCGACVKESIRKCGAECPKCRARITTKRGLRKDNDFEDMMDKVNSAIKSLKCVDISQVNVKEDTEVVLPSGRGSGSGSGSSVKNEEIEETDASKNAVEPENEGFMPRRSKRLDRSLPDQAMTYQENSTAVVKTEEIEDMDASKNAEEPIQENGSESDKEEDREPSVHTDVFSKRKRESSAATSDVSTTPRTRKKVKTAKKKSTKSNTPFDKWSNQLIRFKEEFGHCNVPWRYANNPSLAHWCSHMRAAYKKIQKGMKADRNLSQDMIERLEEIGFQWQGVNHDEIFEKHCRELMAFKEEFGHCNVPRCVNNPSLGQWCSKMRAAYKKIQKGLKANHNLSQDRVERLEEIGFQWQVLTV